MIKKRAALALFGLVALGSAGWLDYSVADRGLWPEDWPKELEPLRKQARTWEGPLLPQRTYEISFTKRDEFEAAWPHILKVKSKGAPVILTRGPYSFIGSKTPAGVVIYTPPVGTDTKVSPEKPIPGQQTVGATWMWTVHLRLVVDGDVVDLNRIPLPPDTPIIDERFKEPENRRAAPTGGTR
jgi:hypothetical protein